MKKIIPFILLPLFLATTGCSTPTASPYKAIYSFTKQEKKIKGTFGKKATIVKDFRENEMYIEDMQALIEEAETYIASHPELSDERRNDLRALKVTVGQAQEEVKLLLGEPDKVMQAPRGANYGASQIWIYKISKLRVYTVFIVPVFPVHEGYYLYFKDSILAGIERHYLQQTIQQGPGKGIFDNSKDTGS